MGQQEEIMKHEEDCKSLCDFCGQSRALLYCRADTAALCLACDRHVHTANSVSSKHPRSLLCDACSAAPSSILCSSHNRVLCSNCDFDTHNNSSNNRVHERRPVEPFSGCPTMAELVSVLGVGQGADFFKKKDHDHDHGFIADLLLEQGSDCVWDYSPQVVRLDDLIVAGNDSSHGFQAMGVPPLPKNRNLACGEQREEILRQLRELIKSESQLSHDFEEEIDPTKEPGNLHSDFNEEPRLAVTPSFEASELQWNNDDWHEATDPVSSISIFPYDHQQQAGNFSVLTTDFHTAHHLVGESLSPLPPKRGLELLCPDRDSVLSRYKEKRKTRRYDKLIRYESRKARAESRVRIKGRFAKVNQAPKS